MPDYYYGFLIVLVLVLVVAALVAIKRMSKIDHLPPEHRAKENELYEAFGLDVHHEELPEDHEEKMEEVEDAFSKLKSTPKKKRKAKRRKKRK